MGTEAGVRWTQGYEGVEAEWQALRVGLRSSGGEAFEMPPVHVMCVVRRPDVVTPRPCWGHPLEQAWAQLPL